ncbi:MAG: hypothetical protein OXE99_11570 [Cellvibrionales bacterium]|nr:hypothetical protein [Cellvibrionales bacterium]
MTQALPEALQQFTYIQTPLPLQTDAIYPLTSWAVISAKGMDATKFLQGQISCDVEKLDNMTATIGSHSTPKGRMISSFRVCKIDPETYYLLIKGNLAEIALAALKKYAMFSKTTLMLEDSIIALAAHGPSAALFTTLGDLPSEANHISTKNDNLLINLGSDSQGYLAITTPNEAQKLLAQANNIYADKQYDLFNHQQGLGFVEAHTSELWVAQMLNYQYNNGISFTKGCYTGQEIIARMKYLGKLKRHMSHALVTTENSLIAGQELHIPEGKQSIGHLVSAVQIGANQWDVLWILTEEGEQADALTTDEGIIHCQETLPLPYSLDDE